ncbi:ey [Trypoxylus dichotomus]
MHHRSYENISNRDPGGHLRAHTPILVEEVVHATMYKLTKAGTGGKETLCQRTWSSRAELSPLLSFPNDKLVRKYNFEKNYLPKLSNKKEWKGKPSTHFLMVNTIIWYTDRSKANKGTGAGVFGPGTKYSDSMGT